MAVLTFKFDESYDARFMAVGGFIGSKEEWVKLERLWQKRIDFENAINRGDQRITRFHASHLNAYSHEFEKWDSSMSMVFSQKLIGILGNRRMGAIGIAADMDAVKAVFPEQDPKKQENLYTLCIKQMMVEIGYILRTFFPGDQVSLVHDHGNWDSQALESYNLMVDDERWNPRNLFVGISSLTGKQSIGLQAADLIAYEVFRNVKAGGIHSTSEMRPAMREFQKKEIAVSAKFMSLFAIQELRALIEASGHYGDMENGGLK